MNPSRDVVITGVGVVSPIGIGREAYWQSLCEGQSGVGPLTVFDAGAMPVPFGAELRGFDARQYVRPRKALKVMCREIQTAFSAAMLAVEDAQFDPTKTSPERIGVVFGSQMLYGDPRELADLFQHCLIDGEFCFELFGEQFPSHLFPLHMLKHLPNMAACHVAIALDARGPNNTIVLGEVSGLLALMEACRVLQRGTTDVMIVGAAGSRICLTAWMYRGDLNLSHRGDDPAAASRPFDADRDGMVNGEGAAALILETRLHAEARGANILAEVCGFGISMDTGHEGAASRSAAIRRSMQSALESSGIHPDQLSHVNAHGLSTPFDDAQEATAIQQLLGAAPVTAPKSYFGNLGPAGGLVELVASVLGLAQWLVPKTLNYKTPDSRCPVNVVSEQPLPTSNRYALKLNHSGTGQTAALVIGRPE
jgi:3-oxoacyl-[acyl-carrier-protein] synthase II